MVYNYFDLCAGEAEVSMAIHNWEISSRCFQTTLLPWNVRHLSPSHAAPHPGRTETSFTVKLLYLLYQGIYTREKFFHWFFCSLYIL